MFKVNGGFRQYDGTVTLVSADNLASHAIGGFKESSSAYSPCRQCFGKNHEIRQQVRGGYRFHVRGGTIEKNDNRR